MIWCGENMRIFYSIILSLFLPGFVLAQPNKPPQVRAEQELQQAQVLHDDGKLEEAIGAYAKIWATQTGRISVSAPAMEDWLGILWQRNQPKNGIVMGDREAAVDGGARYIKLTGPLKDKMEEDDLAKWMRVEKLVKKYQTKLKEEQAEVP